MLMLALGRGGQPQWQRASSNGSWKAAEDEKGCTDEMQSAQLNPPK